jgi:hypothetical protein
MADHALGIDKWDEFWSMPFDESNEIWDEYESKTVAEMIDVMPMINDTFDWACFGDEPFIVIWDKGRVIGAAYLSSRGSMYQAGLYANGAMYFRSNLRHGAMYQAGSWDASIGNIDDKGWVKVDDTVCGEIARDIFDAATKMHRKGA